MSEPLPAYVIISNISYADSFYLQKYHKKAFEAEKAEIKRELASRADEKKKYGDMFEELTKKTEEKIQEYLEQTSKLEACAQNLIEVSV